MQIEDSITSIIFKDITFSIQEIKLINSVFEEIEIKKGDVLLQPNVKVSNQYYVFSGCLRSYFVHTSGKDHTIQFAIKDWWISDYTSFFTTEKSVMSIECLQDAVLYKLSKKNMVKLCENIPSIETFFREKLEKAFAGFQKRILEYLSLPATERYLKFMTDHSDIEKYIKNYHIASYLGVTTESLSRIRKNFSS